MARRKQEPFTIAVADVETSRLIDGCHPRTLFWGLAIEGEGYERFESSEELWRYLEQRTDRLCIYAHTDYDALCLLNDGIPLGIRDVRGGKILRGSGPQKHEWRDSFAVFPSTLAEILACGGFEKPSLDELDARNVADTVDALKAFRQLEVKFERAFHVRVLGERSLTGASLAMRAAELVAGPVPVDLRWREAYRGGRVEAFRVGYCGKADAWDVNSSYPAAFLDLPETDELLYMKVTVETEGPAPLFVDGEEKLLFPAGTFYTYCLRSSYERYIAPFAGVKRVRVLERLPIDCGWLRAVGDGLVRPAFELRAEAKRRGDKALAYACKIALNSVYGRLGLKPLRERAILGDRVAAGGDVPYYPLRDGRFLSFVKTRVKPKANYPYAAAITCNARARLYAGLRAAGAPLYCDTDSVYLPAGTELDVPQGDGLGEWSCDGRDQDLIVIGCKDYSYGGKVSRKGGDRYYRWTLKSIAAGRPVRAVFRSRRSEYDKREVLASGATLPLVFYD